MFFDLDDCIVKENFEPLRFLVIEVRFWTLHDVLLAKPLFHTLFKGVSSIRIGPVIESLLNRSFWKHYC